MQVAAYLSYVPFHAYPLVLEKLREAEMEELYLTIERPTVATLYDMEKYGITVEKDALKEYGDQLVGRIEELEKIFMSRQARHLISIHQNSLVSSYLKI